MDGSIPGERTPQPLFKRVLGIMTKIAAGNGGIGLRVAYVARSLRTVICANLYAFYLLEGCPHFV